MSLPVRRVARVEVAGVAESMVFVVHPAGDRYVSEAILAGGWEPLETEIALRCLQGGGLFLDCGANLGWYSVVMARSGAEVLAIEPAPANLDLLRINVDLNRVGRSVQVFPGAASDQRGTMHLQLSDQNLGDHRVGARIDGRSSIEVDVATLDELLDGRTPRVLKLDTQGSEVAILRGLGRSASRMDRCVLLVEFWPHGLESCGSSTEQLLHLLADFVPSTHRCFAMFNDDDRIVPTSLEALRDLARTPDFSPLGGGHLNVVIVPLGDAGLLDDLVR